jgi:hypothetical protein
MWANPLRGQLGGGWALEIKIFLSGQCHCGPKKVVQSSTNQSHGHELLGTVQ